MVVKKGMSRVNANQAIRKMNTLRKPLEKESIITLEQLGEFGKGLAVGYAPFRTGITARSIVSKSDVDNLSVTITSEPTSHDGSRKNFKNFSLVRWMHTSNKALSHIRTGNPRFMYQTRDELADVAKQRVTGRWRNVVMKINKQ